MEKGTQPKLPSGQAGGGHGGGPKTARRILHEDTNGSENDIRCQVTKRKISGGTRSDP